MPDAGAPLVSVVTPLFEHAEFLPDYLDGLLEQTYERIELIVVDDASSDGSWERLEDARGRLAERFERLVLSRNEDNLGLFATLGRGLAEARGELVAILESDDYYYPAKLERNVQVLGGDPSVGLVHSDVDFLHQADGRLEPAHWRGLGRRIPEGRVFDQLLHDNHILTCAATLRTSVLRACLDLGRYAAAGYETFDYPLFLDVARTSRVAYIDEPLACYRVVEGSISHPRDELGELEWKLRYYRVKMDYVERYGTSAAIRRRARRQYHAALYRSGWLGRDRERLEHGLEGLEDEASPMRRWRRRARAHLARWRWSWRLVRRLEESRRRESAPQGAASGGEPGGHAPTTE